MKISEIIIDESIYPLTKCDPGTVARYCELLKKEIEVVEPKGELLKKLLDILRIKCLTMLNR